jgi:hypothetical protein
MPKQGLLLPSPSPRPWATAAALLAVSATAAVTTKLLRKNEKILRLVTMGIDMSSLVVSLFRLPWLRYRTILLKESSAAGQDCKQEALLVIFPDDRAIPEAYLNLARAFQKKAVDQGLRLHVGIARFFCNRPTWLGEGDAQASLFALTGRASVNQVFVLGHGKGSQVSIRVTRSCTGVMRFGSMGDIPSSSLYSYPKPLLTMAGDRDRSVSYFQLVSLLDGLSHWENIHNAEDLAFRKPVVLVPGLNHGCLVNRSKAKAYYGKQPDLATAIPLEEACSHVVTLCLDFILSTFSATQAKASPLKILQSETYSRLHPYRQLARPEAIMKLATEVQNVIYRGSGSDTTVPFAVIVQFHHHLWDFIFSKPTIEGSTVRVHVFDQGPLVVDGTILLFGSTYGVKCKSRAALQIAFEGNKEMADQRAEHFLDVMQSINRSTFTDVLDNIVTSEEKERYLKEGLKLDFGLDLDFMGKGSLKWIASDLALKQGEDCIISSPIGLTASSAQLPEKFRGMHYCKIMTPAQCYEWIVSQRPATHT